MKIILTAIASLLAFAVSAQGIASQAKDPVGKRVMVTFAASDISNEVLLRDSLEAALAASPLAAAVFRQGPEGEDPIASAARFSCPISLSVRAVGSENGVRVERHFVSSAARNI
jgi:hypothetical protein